MNLTGNTIFLTGGGSGIGRALAQSLQARGNQVIISGRRKALLEEVANANPGMACVELDITDPASIARVARELVERFPRLNVLVNNAGIMKPDTAAGVMDDAVATATVTTNLLGPIRMTSALVEHLKAQPEAYMIHVTSGLAFVPLAMTAVYSATKAALHSYALSQRYLLRGTSVKVLEIAPPYVQTELMGPEQASDPRAMPLGEFLEETLRVLASGAAEVLTERVGFLRKGAGLNDGAATKQLNDYFAGGKH
jgi:uncharacterized oxidoreductase